MSSTEALISRNLQFVNGQPGAVFEPPPDLMTQASRICRWLLNSGMNQNEVARALGIHDNDVRRMLRGDIGYSPRIVRRVLGVETEVVSVIVPITPDTPTLPQRLYLATPLIQHGRAWVPAAPDLTLQEVADLAGCSLRTVQRYVRRGLLSIIELVPGRPPSHRVARVPATEARRWAAWYRAERRRSR